MHCIQTSWLVYKTYFSSIVTAAIYVDQLAIIIIDSVISACKHILIYLQFNIDRGFLVPVYPLPTRAELISDHDDTLSDGGEDDDPLLSFSNPNVDGSQIKEKRNQQQEELPRKKMKHKDVMDDAIFTKKIGKN